MRNPTKTRRLARDYLAAIDKAFLALDRARELRTALRRAAKRQKPKGESRGNAIR